MLRPAGGLHRDALEVDQGLHVCGARKAQRVHVAPRRRRALRRPEAAALRAASLHAVRAASDAHPHRLHGGPGPGEAGGSNGPEVLNRPRRELTESGGTSVQPRARARPGAGPCRSAPICQLVLLMFCFALSAASLAHWGRPGVACPESRRVLWVAPGHVAHASPSEPQGHSTPRLLQRRASLVLGATAVSRSLARNSAGAVLTVASRRPTPPVLSAPFAAKAYGAPVKHLPTIVGALRAA